MEKNHLDISWGSLWRIVIMLALVYFVCFAKDIFISLILSIVISSAIDPTVSFLERKGFPRVLGTLMIFVLLLGSLSLLLYILTPIVLTEINNLLDNLSGIQSAIFGIKDVSEIIKSINADISNVANLLFSGGVSFSSVVSNFIGNLAMVFSVFILSFYLTVDRDGTEKFLRAILPPSIEEKILDIYFRTRYKISKWLQGQFFLSLTVGLAVFIGLSILNVRYALVLAILAGIMEIVPFAGPILSGSFAILIAFPQSVYTAIYVLILFIIIQQTENYLLVPVFMRLTTNLHPAVVLLALMLGGQFLGLVGLILAVPAAVLAQEVINYWEVSKTKKKALF